MNFSQVYSNITADKPVNDENKLETDESHIQREVSIGFDNWRQSVHSAKFVDELHKTCEMIQEQIYSILTTSADSEKIKILLAKQLGILSVIDKLTKPRTTTEGEQ